MFISWLGHSGIKIEYKHGDENAVVLVDPYKAKGEDAPRSLATQLVMLTRGDKETITFQKEPYIVSKPGEYETVSVSVTGLNNPSSKGAAIVYRFSIEGVTFAHLGKLDKTLDDVVAGELDGVDVLMLPVGGHDVLSPADAASLVTRLEPRVVIPMCFQADGTGKGYDTVKKFLKELGNGNTEDETRWRLRKRDLPTDSTQTIIFTKS